jgi:hypothetical protein
MRHIVETCPDDLAQLQERLDSLSDSGARVISVVWQQRRVEEDQQAAAYDASGSFVIVAETSSAERLPIADRELGADAILAT